MYQISHALRYITAPGSLDSTRSGNRSRPSHAGLERCSHLLLVLDGKPFTFPLQVCNACLMVLHHRLVGLKVLLHPLDAEGHLVCAEVRDV
jgi:hypothetical protein